MKNVNEMNFIFARFEDKDDSVCDLPVCNELDDEDVISNETEIRDEFERFNVRKACGPDLIKPNI